MKSTILMAAFLLGSFYFPAESIAQSSVLPLNPLVKNANAKDCHKSMYAKQEAVSERGPLKTKRVPAESSVCPITETPITEMPKGNITNWTRTCNGYFEMEDMIWSTYDQGGAVQIVEGEDNTVYISNPLSTTVLKTWLMGTRDEEGNIHIPGGQAIYEEETESGIERLYMVGLEYYKAEDDEWGYHYPTADGSFTLEYIDGKYVSTDPNLAIGACYWEDGKMEWVGFGDANIVLNQIEEPINAAPESAVFEKWALHTEVWGWFVDVAIDDNKMYVRGMVEDMPDAIAVGQIEGNQVTFKQGQLLGYGNMYHWAFLYGGYMDEVYDAEWGWDYEPKVDGDMVMKYDADAKKISRKGLLVITCNQCDDNYDGAQAYYNVEDFFVRHEVRDPKVPPHKPEGVFAEPYDYEYDGISGGYLYFTLLILDENDCLLNHDDLYYEVYLDGEPYTFEPEDYPCLTEPVTLMPADYSDEDWLISSFGPYKDFYYPVEGVTTFGIQSVYMQASEDGGDPVELRSEIVELVMDEDGVKVVDKDRYDVVATEYYDMQGRKITKPQNGIFLRRDKTSSGNVVVKKVIR